MFSFCKIDPNVLTATINDTELGMEFVHTGNKFPIVIFLVLIRAAYVAIVHIM